uniref:Uncharacterized protein n=1 Tax=Oryza sativa subsp. japonica TaxID=39947 RepID=Q6K1T8_ORYSJ|nr:hypothetical protein [Oryza sativa Japonica Group]
MGHAGREEEEEGVCSMGTTSHRTGHSWSVGSAARDNPTAEMRPVQVFKRNAASPCAVCCTTTFCFSLPHRLTHSHLKSTSGER